jgi:hypothetical protein
MRRIWLAIGLCGCSLSSEGSAPFDEALGDTGTTVADTTVTIDSGEPIVDTATPEDTATPPPDTTTTDTTMAIDTIMPIDTTMPDTTMPDTTVADTFMPDTAPIDTGTIDMGTDAGGPYVTVSTASISSYNINLSDGSPRDWAHWAHPMTDSWNHKATGGGWIAKGTRVGSSGFDSLVYHFSWTGGTPTASVTDTSRGLQLDTIGNSVTFDVKGDSTSETTLDVWVSATGGSATLTGVLTDASTGSAATTITTGVFRSTFKYRPATAAGRLTVELKKTGGMGNYTAIFAAVVR